MQNTTKKFLEKQNSQVVVELFFCRVTVALLVNLGTHLFSNTSQDTCLLKELQKRRYSYLRNRPGIDHGQGNFEECIRRN